MDFNSSILEFTIVLSSDPKISSDNPFNVSITGIPNGLANSISFSSSQHK